MLENQQREPKCEQMGERKSEMTQT